MRTLSATLTAAQKKADRLPHVEAKIYDYHQGIKRLDWTRLHTGAEPDYHHDIAFDGQGSMHRVRTEALAPDWAASTAYDLGDYVSPTSPNGHRYECTTAGTSGGSEPSWPTVNGNTVNDGTAVWTCRAINLYYQKITSPGPGSSFSTWTAVEAGCEGPCAIAASGAKVYIFYKKTDGYTIRKRYSSDYGANWTDGDLTTESRILAMSATWRGATDDVACMMLKESHLTVYGKIVAVVLDSASQATSKVEHLISPIIADAYGGIGCTWQPSDSSIAIVLSGKAAGGVYYRYFPIILNSFSSGNVFGTDRVFVKSPEDSEIGYHYPDCHIPASPLAYETVRVVAAEICTGTSSYTRPITSHMTKGTAWADGVLLDPWPFMDVTTGYGFRLATDATYWWMERPDGVWRAPRTAEATLDLTDDVIAAHQDVNGDAPGHLDIVLDNSDGKYAVPGGWVSPTGHHDSLSKWLDEEEAYDGDLAYPNGARNLKADAGGWLYLSLDNDFTCDRVRLLAADEDGGSTCDPDVKVEAYYSNSWHTIHDGTIADRVWTELSLGGNRELCQARIKSNSAGYNLYLIEFQFYSVGVKMREQVELKLGYKTTSGDESAAAGTYWIDGWEWSSAPGYSTFTLHCLDLWGLAEKWAARYVLEWNRAAAETVLWDVLAELLGRFGIRLWNNPGVSRSPEITTLQPDFLIGAGRHGNTALRKLLYLVSDGLVPYGQEVYAKDLVSDEASCYSYGTDHVILEGEYHQQAHVTQVQAEGRDALDNRLVKQAFDWDGLARNITDLEVRYDPNLTTNDITQAQADAILRHREQQARTGRLKVPVNCGQQLYDVVAITDERVGLVAVNHRIAAIETNYDRRSGRYDQTFVLGAP